MTRRVGLGDFNTVPSRETQPAAEIRPLSDLLEEVSAFLRRFVFLSEAQYVAAALWVVHAHAIEAATATPYLHLTSAELESGKTRFLEVLERLVPRPLWLGASISTASVYRAVAELQPTLLVDEVDNALKDRAAKADLIGVLNMGYLRGKTVVRIGGPKNDRVDVFDVFCAKVIAGLDDLPPTLASRCLRFQMRRKLPSETLADFFADEAEELAAPIRDALALWAGEHVTALRKARPERLGVRDRLEETLRLVLALADETGADWRERGRAALLELAQGAAADSESSRVILLRDIRAAFDEAGADELETMDLLASLFRCAECPYAQWWGDVRRDANGEVLPDRGAAMKLGRMLKGFGIHSKSVGERRRKGYALADFQDSFARYLGSEVAQVAQTAQVGQEPAVSRRSERRFQSDLREPVLGSSKPFERPERLEAENGGERLPAAEPTLDEALRDSVLFGRYIVPYGEFVGEEGTDPDEIERLADLARRYQVERRERPG